MCKTIIVSFCLEPCCDLLKSLVALLGRLTIDQLRNLDPSLLGRHTCRHLLHPILHLLLLLGAPDRCRCSGLVFLHHRSCYFGGSLHWHFYHRRFTFFYVDLDLLHLNLLRFLTPLLSVHLSLLSYLLCFFYAFLLGLAAHEERDCLPTVFGTGWELNYALDQQCYFILGPPGVNVDFLGLLFGFLNDLFETLLFRHHIRGDELDKLVDLLTRLEVINDRAQFLNILVAFRYWFNPKTVILRPFKLIWTEFQQLFYFCLVSKCNLSSLLFRLIFCVLLSFELVTLSLLDVTLHLLTLAGLLCFKLLFGIFFSLFFCFLFFVHFSDPRVVIVGHFCKLN